jgi:hypothetical protein
LKDQDAARRTSNRINTGCSAQASPRIITRSTRAAEAACLVALVFMNHDPRLDGSADSSFKVDTVQPVDVVFYL